MPSRGRVDRSENLRIGIDARAAVEVLAGRGRYVRELLSALNRCKDRNTYVCYARHAWDTELDERFRWRTVQARDPFWHIRVAAKASRECDVFLSTNSFLTAALLRIPSVVVVHDLLAFDDAMGVPFRSAVVERFTLPVAVRRATRFVCPSNATAEALANRYPVTRNTTTVVYLASSSSTEDLSPEELVWLPPKGFVLSVGTLEPRKNLPRLARAYAGLPPDMQSAHPLVIVGASGWKVKETFAAMSALGDRCLTVGHVSDAALAELYRRCAVFCYPSLGEGFGLPVLEAMANGAAVVTSNRSSLPEVGGDAVVYADPASVDSIRSALIEILSSDFLAGQLGARARIRAQGFSWESAAAATLEVTYAAARSGRGSGSRT